MPARIAICTALYEAARPFLDDFIAGVVAASMGRELRLVAAIDDLAAPEALRGRLPTSITLELVRAARPGPAGARAAMMAHARACGADVLLFADSDDILHAEAIARHLAALGHADFSYGDLDLIDAQARPLGRRLFDGAAVPERIDTLAPIVTRNFLGLGNTALRASQIPPAAVEIPGDVEAIDWWFFTTLVLGGLSGAQTRGPVGRYRQHQANALGAAGKDEHGAAVGARLKRQARMLRRHYAAFADAPALVAAAQAARPGLAWLEATPDGEVGAAHAALGLDALLWFDGLTRLLRAQPPATREKAAGAGKGMFTDCKAV